MICEDVHVLHQELGWQVGRGEHFLRTRIIQYVLKGMIVVYLWNKCCQVSVYDERMTHHLGAETCLAYSPAFEKADICILHRRQPVRQDGDLRRDPKALHEWFIKW